MLLLYLKNTDIAFWVSISSVFKKKFILSFLLWTMCCLEVCCLIFTYFGTSSYLFVIDLWFISTVFWEQILYSFCSFTFVKLCFLTQNMIFLGEYFISAWEKISILLFLDEVVYRCQLYIQLIDGVVEFTCIFTDFMPTRSVHF